MKRRFISKRRRRADRKLDDLMSAKHLGRADRDEILAFRDYLRSATSEVRPLILIPHAYRGLPLA